MIIGFGAYLLVLTVWHWVSPALPEPRTIGWYARWVGLGACPTLVGLAALWWERTTGRPGVDVGRAPAETPLDPGGGPPPRG
jgi:hypothetical protein